MGGCGCQDNLKAKQERTACMASGKRRRAQTPHTIPKLLLTEAVEGVESATFSLGLAICLRFGLILDLVYTFALRLIPRARLGAIAVSFAFIELPALRLAIEVTALPIWYLHVSLVATISP